MGDSYYTLQYCSRSPLADMFGSTIKYSLIMTNSLREFSNFLPLETFTFNGSWLKYRTPVLDISNWERVGNVRGCEALHFALWEICA